MLKNSGDRATPCFRPFLIGNKWDKFLPTRTLLYLSFRHIFINLTIFMGKPYRMRILYKTSLLIEWKHKWSKRPKYNNTKNDKITAEVTCLFLDFIHIGSDLISTAINTEHWKLINIYIITETLHNNDNGTAKCYCCYRYRLSHLQPW